MLEPKEPRPASSGETPLDVPPESIPAELSQVARDASIEVIPKDYIPETNISLIEESISGPVESGSQNIDVRLISPTESAKAGEKPLDAPPKSIPAMLSQVTQKASIELIPKEYLAETNISLIEESRSGPVKSGSQYVDVRLINPTQSAVSFMGYGESSPWYRIQKRNGADWEEHRVGWFCGTGLRSCVVPAGCSSLIRVRVENEKLFPMRVGVDYSQPGEQQPQVVWSEAIN